MHRTTFKIKGLAAAVAAAVLSVSPLAHAQDDAIEEIQVTGTRIRATDGMVSPTPITAVTMDELADFEPASTIAEQLDNLPQFLNTQTAQRGGGTLFGDAAGSYLNLRNMGKQRTLVLFDGSRVVPADRASTVNVDNFPTALIRTVDVVTGGASAAYGADALAGVVNFVLDREFEGFKATASTGRTEFGDGENFSFSMAGGRQFGNRLHLIGSIEARTVDQINRRPQTVENWNSIGWVINPAWSPGDTSVPQRLTVPHVHSATQHPAGMISAPGLALDGYVFTDDGRNVRPFGEGDIAARTGSGSNGMMAGGAESSIFERAYTGGPDGAGVDQRSGFAAIKYDLSDTTEIFAQVMAGRTESKTTNRLGSLEMGQGYYWTAYADNAFMPETLRQAMLDEGLDSVRIYKIGQIDEPGYDNFYDNRNDVNISQMWSGTVGFDHLFNNGWGLRGTYQYGESKLTSEGENMLRIDRWYMAMDAVRDPDTGSIMCNVQRYNPTADELAASVAGMEVATTMITVYPDGVRPIPSPIVDDNAIRDCQPLNIFGLGNVSDEAANYVTSNKKGIRDLDQDFAELLLTGELYQGWGAGPVSFAAGLTWREEWFNQLTIPISMERSPANAPEIGIRGMSAGITGGNRSMHLFSATSWATGSFDVWEWFGEMNVPVWQSDSGSQRLDTNLAYRQSDYSSSGTIDSWKLGAEMQVYDDLRLRVTRSRDVREPTFGEQFEARGGGANIEDPVTNTSYTITQLAGGNPSLKPEEADTLTAGLIYQPGWLPGFQTSVDWYKIDVSGRVGSLGGQRIIDECFAGDQSLCGLITRGSAGTIERVLNVNLNVAGALTEGVDVEARYNMEPDFFENRFEALNFRLLAGHLIENSVTTQSYRDQVGNLTNPEWTALASMGYDVGPFGATLVGRYYDSTVFDDRWVEGINVDDNTRASNTVANLVLRYRGETANGATWTTSLNVSNLFDREPPINPGQSQRSPAQQSINDNFDPYGRRYQLSFNYSF